MSRSALVRGANVVEQRRISTLSLLVSAQESSNLRTDVQLTSNLTNDYNINSMLSKNILEHNYFADVIGRINNFDKLVDEIYNTVTHMLPWNPNVVLIPSNAFILLYRLLVMKINEKQIFSMLDHLDSPFIRCIGFLYVRYIVEPLNIWDFYKNYVYDSEEFALSPKGRAHNITMGTFVKGLLNDVDYYGTVLPRLPVAIQRDYKVRLLKSHENEQRALHNLRVNLPTFVAGCKVQGLYEDKENPIQWYDGIIDGVEPPKQTWERPRFWVTFTDYGNQELLDVGCIDVRGYDNNKNQGDDREDMEIVKRNERNKSQANKGEYVHRGNNTTLIADPNSSKHDKRKRSRSPDRERDVIYVQPVKFKSVGEDVVDDVVGDKEEIIEQPVLQVEVKRTSGEIKRIDEKKKQLANAYG